MSTRKISVDKLRSLNPAYLSGFFGAYVSKHQMFEFANDAEAEGLSYVASDS